MKLYFSMALLALLTVFWPSSLRPGPLQTDPPGARIFILQTHTELPGLGGKGGGTTLREVGSTPGPLQLAGADFPAILMIQMEGYESQQLEIGHIEQLSKLHPVLVPRNSLAPLLLELKRHPGWLGAAAFMALGLLARRKATLRQRRLLQNERRIAAGMVEPGDEIAGYTVEEMLGVGGMGVVYRCRQLKSGGDKVSLKLLKRQSLGDAGARLRLAREAEACRSLRHPGLLFLLDWGEWRGLPYLAYEFVAGEPLDSYAAGVLDRAFWAADLACQLAEALSYLHQEGVIHRDLKPSNVLVDAKGRVRLMDFGIASLKSGVEASAMTGTPGYVAPEILLSRPYDSKVDGYALAALIYWAFSGRPAFEGASAVEIMDAQLKGQKPNFEMIPPGYREVLSRWLEADPGQRGDPDLTTIYAELRLKMLDLAR